MMKWLSAALVARSNRSVKARFALKALTLRFSRAMGWISPAKENFAGRN
ncbi:MAG: hypothetical protein KBS82_04165 [Oscillospiraceae bacterium]|nr:hypothetical protein [Candidatus Limimonas egerieequi]